MKQVIDLRPVYHRREDRIRAHVILCWLALLLIRVIENTAGQPWNRTRAELQRMHAVTWTGPAGTFRQTTDLTKPLRDLYIALSIDRRRRSSPWTRHPQPPDLREHHRLVTRPVTGLFRVPAGKHGFFGH